MVKLVLLTLNVFHKLVIIICVHYVITWEAQEIIFSAIIQPAPQTAIVFQAPVSVKFVYFVELVRHVIQILAQQIQIALQTLV